jgi:plastocyanin
MKITPKFVIGIVVCGLICGAGGLWLYLNQNGSGTQTESASEILQEEADIVITRTKNGYEPKEITIAQGDVVEWKNESGEFHWPASDLHPTHGIYPEFDPLRPIADGESWKFKFEQVGVWKYHDHIRANKVGTVTVQ